MKLTTKLAAVALVLGSASSAQAATYSVDGVFYETMTNGVNTEFHGTFDWDGTTVSNFTGTMNESMRGYWTNAAGHTYTNYGDYASLGKPNSTALNTYWGQVNDLAAKGTFMLNLNQNLIQSDNGTTHTATIFKENTSNVYWGGGYVGNAATNNYIRYGNHTMMYPQQPGETVNENAFFTLAFNHDAAGNITSLGFNDINGNPVLVNQMIYGDCTVGSLMMSGQACMAGEPLGESMMAATALSLKVTQLSSPAPVPVPAAAWLFGGGLMGLIGASRRKSVVAA